MRPQDFEMVIKLRDLHVSHVQLIKYYFHVFIFPHILALGANNQIACVSTGMGVVPN